MPPPPLFRITGQGNQITFDQSYGPPPGGSASVNTSRLTDLRNLLHAGAIDFQNVANLCLTFLIDTHHSPNVYLGYVCRGTSSRSLRSNFYRLRQILIETLRNLIIWLEDSHGILDPTWVYSYFSRQGRSGRLINLRRGSNWGIPLHILNGQDNRVDIFLEDVYSGDFGSRRRLYTACVYGEDASRDDRVVSLHSFIISGDSYSNNPGSSELRFDIIYNSVRQRFLVSALGDSPTRVEGLGHGDVRDAIRRFTRESFRQLYL